MENKKGLIVFDVDGTLLDTKEGLISSVKFVLENNHLPMVSDDVLETFIGPPIQESFAKHFKLSSTDIDALALEFRNRYKDHDLLKAKEYPHMLSVVTKLSKRGYDIAIATYKRQDYAEKIVYYFGFGAFSKATFGSDFEGKLKKADIIRLAIDKAGYKHDIDKVVMVGDSYSDFLGAQVNKVNFVGVTYGYGFTKKSVLNDPCVITVVDKPTELLTYFE